MSNLPEHFTLEVVTPERRMLQESAREAQLPGLDGYLGILPGHAPLITELGVGILSYRDGGQTSYLTIIQGFAEVLPDRVIVLAEVSERAEEIDVERAREAQNRAQALLARRGDPEVDWERAAAALQRAMVRQQAATRGGMASREQ